MIFLRLERGVSGQDLEGMGYKVGTIRRRKTEAEKAAALKARILRHTARERERRKHMNEEEREALRLRWREAKRRRRDAASEMVGQVPRVRADVPRISDAGLRPSGDGVLSGMQDVRGGG